MRPALTAAFVLATLTAVPGYAAAQGCAEEAGRADAEAFVEECLQVSPATHPPCNVENACALMVEEITRGCAMIIEAGEPAPDFCADYVEGVEGEEAEPDGQ
jgi:hypothetical protein